jgi:hypothetical protein
LKRAWRIEKWGDPFGGGWYDWPAGWLTRMNVALNVYNTFASYSRNAQGGKLGEWLDNNPKLQHTYTAVLELRVKNGYYSATIKDRD